ncbi:allatostatin-A receptor-like isoform X2 [Eriocheir sinensis]|uniref:allatostatin-A receptor-like isoform X2 n=1 Tax=Eriocheir sinensis TaxID=95602 RepID=UPI0021C742D7|nr:allatostatin-A receptor-like isoform X2 [Eriocheir sinensis]
MATAMAPAVIITELQVSESYMGAGSLDDNVSFFGASANFTTPGALELLTNASHSPLERNFSAAENGGADSEWMRVAEELNCKTFLENITSFRTNCLPLDDPMEMTKPHKANPSFVPIVVTHALTFLLGVSGNSIIVFSMAKDKGTRNVTSWFLVSLAVADLLLLLLCVPLETLQYFLWTPNYTLPVCKLSSYFELLSAVASVLNLTAVSLERYLVIVYPMRSRSFCTLSNCRRAILGVWCISLVLSVPAGYTQDVYSVTYFNVTHNVTVTHCDTGGDHDLTFAVYRLVIVFLLPALFMSFFYARVIKALWVSTKTMSAMTRVYSISSHHSLASCSVTSGFVHSSPSVTSGFAALHASCPVRRCVHRQRSGEEVKQARKQVIKMLILVIILFMACWGPKIVFFVFQKNGFSQESFKPLVYNIRICFGLLPFVHCCLNPIIYSFMSTNFGRMMRRSCAQDNCSTLLNNLCLGTARYRHRAEGVGYDLANTSFLDLNGHTPSPSIHPRPNSVEDN